MLEPDFLCQCIWFYFSNFLIKVAFTLYKSHQNLASKYDTATKTMSNDNDSNNDNSISRG